MGISFKVSKAGKRYRPKLLLDLVEHKDENSAPTEPYGTASEGDFAEVGDEVANNSIALVTSASHSVSEGLEVSFTLNLFPDGFCVGKANELLDRIPKKLPYNRASKSFFSAIEYGCLPGDILDDIPCKYVDGSLLCEIRDYRNTLSNEEDGTFADKSPIIHKVVLKLCMENVVKDISSFSDDSWTYSDLLEVESRILKALKPVLHLNPKPLLHNFGQKIPSKKIDLRISWTRKRKVSDTSINRVIGSDNLQCVQNLNCHSQVAEGSREIPLERQIIPRSGPTSQENYNLQEAPSESFGVPSHSDSLAGSENHSVSAAQTPSICHSTPKQCVSNRQNNLRKASTLISSGPTDKILKQEPLDLSEQQWKRNPLNQQIEAEKVLHEKADCRKRPLVSLNGDKQATLEGIPKLRAGIATCGVKEKPRETGEFSHLAKSFKVTNMARQSNLQSLNLSPPLSANAPPSSALLNQICQSVPKSTANEIINEKKEVLIIAQASSGIGNKYLGSCLGNSLETPMPTKKKSNSCLKNSGTSRAKSPASTSNMGATNAIVHEEPSNNGIIDRFSKIGMLTQRYGLNKENHKRSQVFEKKPFFYSFPNVNLGGSEMENLRYGSTYSFHANTQENKFIICKTRTLKFVRSPCVSERSEIGSEGQTKLIIMERVKEGVVEASFVYGDGKDGSIELPRLQSFPSSDYANLFAVQFTFLMEREGLQVVCDEIEYVPLSIEGRSAVQQPALTNSTFLSSETMEQSPNIPGPSQLMSENNFLGNNIFPHGNIQVLQPSNFPMAPFNIAAQLAPLYQQRQQAINQRYILQFQRMERERIQQQLLQKRMIMGGGGLPVAAPHLGTVQPGGGTQMGMGSSNNVMGVYGSSMSVIGRASTSGLSVQRIDNMSQQQLLFATNMARNVVQPPLGVVNHMDPRLQMSQAQLGSALVAQQQQMEVGKAVMGHGSPEPSSRNHGSVGSCNTSSSMELQGVVKVESLSQTGGGK